MNDGKETHAKDQRTWEKAGEEPRELPRGGEHRLEPEVQSRAPPTRDPERTRRPILGGSTHQELEHDVGREGEEGVKGASATARLPDSSPARGRNPPSGSGLRPAPPSPCPEATCGAAAPPDSHRGKQCKPSLRTKASLCKAEAREFKFF